MKFLLGGNSNVVNDPDVKRMLNTPDFYKVFEDKNVKSVFEAVLRTLKTERNVKKVVHGNPKEKVAFQTFFLGVSVFFLVLHGLKNQVKDRIWLGKLITSSVTVCLEIALLIFAIRTWWGKEDNKIIVFVCKLLSKLGSLANVIMALFNEYETCQNPIGIGYTIMTGITVANVFLTIKEFRNLAPLLEILALI